MTKTKTETKPISKVKIKKEVKYMRGLGKVLIVLADEVEIKGCFSKGDLNLLKKIGSNILWQGATIGYIN